MVRAEKYIRFSQVTEGFLGASLQFEKGIIINSLQFIVNRLLVTIYSLQFIVNSLQIIVNWGVIC